MVRTWATTVMVAGYNKLCQRALFAELIFKLIYVSGMENLMAMDFGPRLEEMRW